MTDLLSAKRHGRRRAKADRSLTGARDNEMQVDRIKALRPAERTAAAIEASLQAAARLKAVVEEELSVAQAARGALLVGGDDAAVDENKAAMSAAEETLRDIDDFVKALTPTLEVTRRAEHVARLQARYDALDVDAAVQAFAENWRANYLPHAQAIRDLCLQEKDAMERVRVAHIVRNELAQAGVEVAVPQQPMYVAMGPGITGGFRSIGDMIRLPGLLGAPNIRLDCTPRYTPVMVERPDWDSVGCRDSTGKPMKTKWVEEQITDITPRSVREDTEVWWPR